MADQSLEVTLYGRDLVQGVNTWTVSLRYSTPFIAWRKCELYNYSRLLSMLD